ncbi:MAG: 4-hydroxyphenylacetate 3-hydroxylase C-terminal domain-containing protein [Paracoccaceae bacterium]
MLNQQAMPRIKNIIEQIVASGLIYLNSHTADFKSDEIRGYLDKYVRGSGGSDAVERVKVMKMLWDAIGKNSAAGTSSTRSTTSARTTSPG